MKLYTGKQLENCYLFSSDGLGNGSNFAFFVQIDNLIWFFTSCRFSLARDEDNDTLKGEFIRLLRCDGKFCWIHKTCLLKASI